MTWQRTRLGIFWKLNFSNIICRDTTVLLPATSILCPSNKIQDVSQNKIIFLKSRKKRSASLAKLVTFRVLFQSQRSHTQRSFARLSKLTMELLSPFPKQLKFKFQSLSTKLRICLSGVRKVISHPIWTISSITLACLMKTSTLKHHPKTLRKALIWSLLSSPPLYSNNRSLKLNSLTVIFQKKTT